MDKWGSYSSTYETYKCKSAVIGSKLWGIRNHIDLFWVWDINDTRKLWHRQPHFLSYFSRVCLVFVVPKWQTEYRHDQEFETRVDNSCRCRAFLVWQCQGECSTVRWGLGAGNLQQHDPRGLMKIENGSNGGFEETTTEALLQWVFKRAVRRIYLTVTSEGSTHSVSSWGSWSSYTLSPDFSRAFCSTGSGEARFKRIHLKRHIGVKEDTNI